MSAQVVESVEGCPTPTPMVLVLLVDLDVSLQGIFGLEGQWTFRTAVGSLIIMLIAVMHLQSLLSMECCPTHFADEPTLCLEVQGDVPLQVVHFVAAIATVTAVEVLLTRVLFGMSL